MKAITIERDHLKAYSALHPFRSFSIILKVSLGTRSATKRNCRFFVVDMKAMLDFSIAVLKYRATVMRGVECRISRSICLFVVLHSLCAVLKRSAFNQFAVFL